MTLAEVLQDVWRQVLVERKAEVIVQERPCRVDRTRGLGLRTVYFTYGEFSVEGIEQNPATRSNWAKLAQEGKRIMQFRCRNRYVANVCEGALTRYPAWSSAGLPA